MRIQSQQRFRQHAIRDMPRRHLHGSGPAEKPAGRVFHPGVLNSQTVRADGGVEDPPGAGADDAISMGRGGEVEDLLICADHDGADLPGIGGEARGEGDVGTGLGCTKDERSWDVAALPCRCHARFPLSILILSQNGRRVIKWLTLLLQSGYMVHSGNGLWANLGLGRPILVIAAILVRVLRSTLLQVETRT